MNNIFARFNCFNVVYNLENNSNYYLYFVFASVELLMSVSVNVICGQ